MSDGANWSPTGTDWRIHPTALIDDDSVIGKRVTIGPRALLVAGGQHPERSGAPRLRDDVTVGAGSVLIGGIAIGVGARIEPGTVVTDDVPPHAIIAGNPSRVIGYSVPSGPDRVAGPPVEVQPPAGAGSVDVVAGARLFRFSSVVDLRGALTFGELGSGLPFPVERFFVVHDVPNIAVRGEHAHRTLHELLICIGGSIRISLTDGVEREDVMLDSPDLGLHIPPYVWSTQYQYSPEASLIVLCSEGYDASSYIRSYDDYLAESRRHE